MKNGGEQQGLTRTVLPVIGAILLAVQVGCALPLLHASASGDTKQVGFLLQNGHHADEAFPIVGTRPLMVAAANGHIETVKALLSTGADVNARDLTGWTALHAAAFHGDVGLVALLLRHGAVQSEDKWFLQSPAKIAESLDHKDVAPLLQKREPVQDGILSSFVTKAPQ